MNQQLISSYKTQSFPENSGIRLFVIGFLFLAAFGVRLYHITEPTFEFSPTREYISAFFARSLYYENVDSVPEWKRNVVNFNVERKDVIVEFWIMERMVSFASRLMGGEYLWFSKLFSSLFWMVGGAFLYLIARKILPAGEALFSTAFYLFLPFSISASRSFMPDPLMIMMLLITLYGVLKYYEKPTIYRLLTVSVVSGLAILVKPMGVFLIFAVFITLGIYRGGIWKTLINKNLVVFGIISVLPFTIYTFASEFFKHIGEAYQTSFNPRILLYPDFWTDWFAMIGRVVGYIAFAGAVTGIFMFQKGFPRTFITALWIGYLTFCMAFNTRINIHDYYHLQLIPVVALSLGPISGRVFDHLKHYRTRYITAAGIVFTTTVLIAGIGTRGVDWSDIIRGHKSEVKLLGSIIGVNPQFINFINPDSEKKLRIAKEISDIVGHNGKVIILDSNFGIPLSFLGELKAYSWQTNEVFKLYKVQGRQMAPVKLFNKFYKRWGYPEYFIVADFTEFEKQPQLKEFLNRNFPVLVSKDDYLIYDLRKKASFYK